MKQRKQSGRVAKMEGTLEFVREMKEDARKKGCLGSIMQEQAPDRNEVILWLLLKYIVRCIPCDFYDLTAQAIRFLDREHDYIVSFTENHIDEIKPIQEGCFLAWEAPLKLVWGCLELLIEKEIEKEKGNGKDFPN